MKEHNIANWKLLQENYKVDDLLDLSQKEESFWNQIKKIQGPSIIFITAPAGTGKSTFIYNMLKRRLPKKQYFIFEGWRYADRKMLWYAFINEFAQHQHPNLNNLKSLTNRISAFLKYVKLDILLAILSLPSSIYSLGIWVYRTVSGLNSSPPNLKTIKYYERKFFETIRKIDKNHIIVLDDIDRCGEEGLIFLETIYRAIKQLPLNYNFKVIVPLTNTFYKDYQYNLQKMQDYHFRFSLEDVNWINFFQRLLNTNEFRLFNYANQESCNKTPKTKQLFLNELNQITRTLTRTFRYQFTIRKLKAIIREAIVHYEALPDNFKDFRIIYILTATKYFKEDNKKEKFLSQHFIPSYNAHLFSHPKRIMRNLIYQVALSDCETYINENQLNERLKDNTVFNRAGLAYSNDIDMGIRINYMTENSYLKLENIELHSVYQQIFRT